MVDGVNLRKPNHHHTMIDMMQVNARTLIDDIEMYNQVLNGDRDLERNGWWKPWLRIV